MKHGLIAKAKKEESPLHYTCKPLSHGSDAAEINQALQLLEAQNPETIDKSTLAAIRTKLEREEALLLTAAGENGAMVGASFSLLHSPDDEWPAAVVYTYEAGEMEVKRALLAATSRVVDGKTKECPIFFEGATDNLFEEESRGMRRLRYDSHKYQWCDGEYIWMVLGENRPSIKELQAAIYTQRSFVLAAEQPDAMQGRLDKKLAEQAPAEFRGDYSDANENGYGIDSSIIHAASMAMNDKMLLMRPLRTARFMAKDK